MAGCAPFRQAGRSYRELRDFALGVVEGVELSEAIWTRGKRRLALLSGEDGVGSELKLGVGWQDPAIIQETGICVWKSGLHPELHFKRNGDMLRGLMAILFTERRT